MSHLEELVAGRGDLIHECRRYLEDLQTGGRDRELERLWISFHRKYSLSINRLALSFGVPADELENCEQEVWISILTILRRLDDGQTTEHFDRLLSRVVRNKVVDILRRRRVRDRCVKIVAFSSLHYEISPLESPAARFERQWAIDAIRGALDQFRRVETRMNYRILILCRMRGFRNREAARCLGLTPTQLSGRLSRVEKRFRRFLRSCAGRKNFPAA